MSEYKYKPTTWIGGKTIGTADVMNNIEDGIEKAHETLDVLVKSKNYITYEEFGVKCDGVYDDGIAIKKAHEYANLHNLKVVAQSKTYYIKETTNIDIQTSVDFNGATFIIDDTLTFDRKNPVFKVSSKKDKVTFLNPLVTVNKSTKEIPLFKGYGNCLLELYNSGKKVFIRKGANADNGVSQSDYVVIDNNGKLLNDIIWDFEKITEAYLYPIDNEFLTIKNGNFITKVNNKETEYKYFERGFIVYRSNVIFEGISHELTDEVPGSPYDGFIHGKTCANLYIKDSVFQSHICYKNSSGTPMGTYDLRFDRVVNLRLDNVIDRNFSRDRWGIFTSNHCKDVIIEKCKLTRVDAHRGVHNITIRDCTLGHQSIQLIGSGDCIVENTSIFDAVSLVCLRGDYGSTWDGDMYLRNIKFLCQDIDYTPKMVEFTNNGTHDYGYKCYFPKKLFIENVYVDDTKVKTTGSFVGMYIIYNEVGKTGTINESYKYPYVFSEYIECKNLKTKSGLGFMMFTKGTENLYSDTQYSYEEVEILTDNSKFINIIPNAKIVLDNVELQDYSYVEYSSSNIIKYTTGISGTNDNFLSNKNRVVPELIIKNCKNVFAFTGDNPMILKLENCIVKRLLNKHHSVRMIGSANDCIFQPVASSSMGCVSTNYAGFNFINCYFDKAKINNNIVTNVNEVLVVYPFLQYCKPVGNRHIHVQMRMSNCRMYNSFNFDELNSQIKYCGFKFGNHDFEYYLSSHGYDGEKPKIEDCFIPVGFNYWVTSQSKFITWNGTEWI